MTEKEDNSGPAFPSTQHGHGGEFFQDREGMSLRDWFAGQALASMGYVAVGETGPQHKAKQAYALADAMLVERRK